MKIKVSDAIAAFLAARGVTHAFGISGAGDLHMFDSVGTRPDMEIICTHHEQAATMACHGFFLAQRRPAVAILTTGGGAANGFTGVLGAHMDSIPMVVLSGNEQSKHTRPDNTLRVWGVQGFDVIASVRNITKYAVRIIDPKRALYEMHKAWYFATLGKPGPVWIDVPMNVQSAFVEETEWETFDPAVDPEAKVFMAALPKSNALASVPDVLKELRQAERPVIWLGQGIRHAGGYAALQTFLELCQAPFLLSWSGIDLVDSDHPRNFGRAGVYGHRCGNFVLQNSDFVLTIGTRLAIPQVGYDITEFARAAKVAVVEIDPVELEKYASRYSYPIQADAREFLEFANAELAEAPIPQKPAWQAQCTAWRDKYPWEGPEHADADGYMSGFRLLYRLPKYLKPDQVIVTDAGTAAMATHTMMKVKPPQRLSYSMGLGEMGWGLPAAVGTCIANGRTEVLCINCDGSMMMNLQELQTIAHHKLPIRIIVISNEGYLSIKLSQQNMFKGRYIGSHPASGVSCPDFVKVARAFDMPAFTAKSWEELDRVMPEFMAMDGPCIIEIFTHPEQPFLPKLGVSLKADGSLVSPPLEDLSPFLPRDEMRANMLIGMHPKSEQV
jgi:acetolactate synthase I/II/III large subunit